MLAAKKQNRFWGLTSKLFKNNLEENHQPLTEEKVLEYASELGLDTEQLKKDAYSEEIKNKLEDEINDALEKGMNSTPSYIVNGRDYNGLLRYSEWEKIVKDAGAVKKR